MKSGYWLSTHLPAAPDIIPTFGNPRLKHRIWETKIPPKIKHFVWKLMSKSLATGENLQRRHIIQQPVCKRCCQGVETELHIFFECPYVKMVWRGSGISNTVFNSSNVTLEERIEACFT